MYKYIIIILLTFHFAEAQERLVLKHFSFSMEKPEKWVVAGDTELLENLERLPLSDTLHNFAERNLKSEGLRISYYKYDPQTSRGTIPTINIVAKKVKKRSFESLKVSIEKSDAKLHGMLKNHTATVPQIRVINGFKAWQTISEFDFTDSTGKEVRLKNIDLYLYSNGNLISVTFIDEIGKEDNSAFYNRIAETIRMTD